MAGLNTRKDYGEAEGTHTEADGFVLRVKPKAMGLKAEVSQGGKQRNVYLGTLKVHGADGRTYNATINIGLPLDEKQQAQVRELRTIASIEEQLANGELVIRDGKIVKVKAA